LPNSYVSRRSTEAQALSPWQAPTGTLGQLVEEARARAEILAVRASELRRAARGATSVPSFATALRSGSEVTIIAELKRSSPSKGKINAGIAADDQARAFERGGAGAISVVTEQTRFAGSNEDLVRAHAVVGLPLLKKDFHVEVLQLLEARALGASAALVIARAVPPERMRDLLAAGRDIGLEILVEVRDLEELERALSFDAQLIGVNNRNLETLEIDPETAQRVIPAIPSSCIAIAESGLRNRADVERAAAAGADAVLVGSELSASSDPAAAVRSLTGVRRASDARQN